MTAVVAAHDPPGPAKLRAVVAGHRVPVGAEQAVHADAVAAMVLSRAVAVAATAEVQAANAVADNVRNLVAAQVVLKHFGVTLMLHNHRFKAHDDATSYTAAQ